MTFVFLALVIVVSAIVPGAAAASSTGTRQLPMPSASMLDSHGKLIQQALGRLFAELLTTGHMPAYDASVYPRSTGTASPKMGDWMVNPNDGITGDFTCWAWSDNIGSDEWGSETTCDVPTDQWVSSVLSYLDPVLPQYDFMDSADGHCNPNENPEFCPQVGAIGYDSFYTGQNYLVSGVHYVMYGTPYPAYTFDPWEQCDGCGG